MNPNSPNTNHPPVPSRFHNPLEVMSAGEQNLFEIKRHPFGLIGLYISAGLAVIVVVIVAVLAPQYVAELKSSEDALYAVAFGVVILALLYTYIGAVIYNGNRWVVTSDSITQISQTGLFSKQTSQLSLANLEDVTFEQDSFVQTMFGFGTLKVETAGERSKFSFPFCPNPNYYAKEIIRAHEQFIQLHPEEGQQNPVNSYNATPQQQPQSSYAAPLYPQPTNAQQQPYYVPPAQQSQQPPAGYTAPVPPEHQANDPTNRG